MNSKLSAILLFIFSVNCYALEGELFKSNLEDRLNEIDQNIVLDLNNSQLCSVQLSKYYSNLFNFNSQTIKLADFSENEMKNIVQASFEIRVKLKQAMKSIDLTSKTLCLRSAKELTKALRYLEDYFIEYFYKRSGRIDEDFTTLAGDGIHFLKARGVEFDSYSDLKGGDVLISRGNAYTSAAIARIGVDDYQFSHLSMIHTDKEDTIYTTEAHIEIGNVVAPIQVHLDQKNARTVVFRSSDQRLAKRAGEYSFNYTKDFRKNNGYNIQYDFAMDYKDTERVFCSEVASMGYLNAAKELYGENLEIPFYKTKFNEGLIPFLNDLGIKVTKENIDEFDTFAPGDMQFDPRFDIVAEWRNPAKLEDTRFKDAILTKFLEWIEKDNYKFKTSIKDRTQNSLAWLIRRSNWLSDLTALDEKFPLNMTKSQMNIFTSLEKVGETFYRELVKKQSLSAEPLTFQELYKVLEEFKDRDLATYKKYKNDKRKNLINRRRGRTHRVKLTKPKFHLSFSA